MEAVTDPAILAQLNSNSTPQAQEVTDPALLAQLNAPDEGAPMAFGRGLARNSITQQVISAAAPVLNKIGLADKPDYSGEMQHMNDAAEASKAAHGTAYGAGAVTGTVGPLFIPGVGEALEAAPILGNAALGAAQGIYDTNVVAHPGQAAGQAIIGGGIGGVTGGITDALGKYFAGKAAPAVEKAVSGEATPLAESIAAPTSNNGVEASFRGEPEGNNGGNLYSPDFYKSTPSAPPKVPPSFGVTQKPVAADFVNPQERASASLIAQGLGGTPRQQLKLYIGKDPVVALNEIGTWMKTAENGKSIAGIMDRPGELLKKIETIHDDSGKTIGDVIDKIAPGANVDGGEIAFRLDKLLDETYDANAEHAILKLQGQIQKAEQAGRLDFQAIQKIKSSFGAQAKAAGHDMAGSSVKQAYGILSQYMNDAVDQFGAHINNPELLAQYNRAKIDYKNTSNLLPILRYQEAKELIGGPSGHTTLLGLVGKIANQGATALGVTPPQQIVKNALLTAGTAFSPSLSPVAAPAARGVVQATAPAVQAAAPNVVNRMLPRAAQLGLTNAAQSELKKSLENKFGKKGNQ